MLEQMMAHVDVAVAENVCLLAVVIGRAAPLRVGNNTVIILLLKDGFYRMSSSCVMGATASGGVTF